MVGGDCNPGTAKPGETPEEAAKAIANALRFLRDEARALGMYDVHVVIELARATAYSYCRRTSKGGRG